MLGVTFFGLLFTPVFYVFVRWIGEALRRAPGGRTEQPATEIQARTEVAS